MEANQSKLIELGKPTEIEEIGYEITVEASRHNEKTRIHWRKLPKAPKVEVRRLTPKPKSG